MFFDGEALIQYISMRMPDVHLYIVNYSTKKLTQIKVILENVLNRRNCKSRDNEANNYRRPRNNHIITISMPPSVFVDVIEGVNGVSVQQMSKNIKETEFEDIRPSSAKSVPDYSVFQARSVHIFVLTPSRSEKFDNSVFSECFLSFFFK